MKIVEVSVNAGRTFNHPYESFSNLRASVDLKAALDGAEDAAAAVVELQARAEDLVENHKDLMLARLWEEHADRWAGTEVSEDEPPY